MKVMVIVGTRPEIIRLSRVIILLRETFDCVFVHTGQNYSYELGEIFYKDLELDPPDYYLNAVGNTLAETLGLIISKSDEVMEKEAPDALLVLGDTNSALSVIPAKRRKIPIFHFEAGNRCFDQRVPEEINRRIVDHTADINLTYSEIAKQNLLREGLPMDRVFNIGSPMFEVLECYKDKINQAKVLEKFGLKPDHYFVLSAHREENVDSKDKLNDLMSAIESVLVDYPFPILFSVHPRTEKKLKEHGLMLNDRIIASKPLCFTEYVALQKHAYCVLSDSGTITEESAILNIPALNLRETHERHEGMEKAAVTMTGFDPKLIKIGINIARRQVDRTEVQLNSIPDYAQKNISEKVVKIILSYTSYINRKSWLKV
ncbi:UDP-N-acetylglucosamine 2-epimerase (non-hydrolyzing) [Marispirochaeta aestuarii]|uniref:UDP-N-acetylglucosamine 2-epimerase (Non-hydrolyzing) n=1 Tax=Marispirochaeta aestuarii TaxID=1963862 RepID=A0A1Y1RXU6_9SPIO|nr:UDP-N-acetylglucosamine 2-epimerase (non-hydrolyzing) [Marispirochaeta aestuarii]ORC34641.1 UDP-N-acetylglucosamine 2-epimerase (non-hydrolyzing) [Marispirochaeta aestuarii]